ncbi:MULTISPECIES: hypothetical protein [unclassified Streptomyces]|uniref:hypothetical protein n=1 Tax=unclassified Streptomyces TaxID=2593676 RepID=UPI00136B65D5|nr:MULTISPECIES: hypothetical protein [unclassified Streptomyces]MYY79913.1 hypothetical protein [Streptomyces sp. SID335]MYZ16212.1 hypothetical protein [Streptomyces sp. SID337]NDZ84862.1 hypothetical protein [Streptomyces sp. SID10115]NEB50669.1 hypothetical protein [Streptomyces sp. SID339]
MARTGPRIGDGTGRLLLLAALLLGIVTMHTLGHPSGDHGGAPEPAAMRHTGATTPPPHPPRLDALSHGTDTAQPERDAAARGTGAADPRPGANERQLGAAAHQAGAAVQYSGAAAHRHGVGDRLVADASHGSGDGMAMDPLSVCLAVLGAFTLLVLVRAGLLRPGGVVDRSRTPGRLLHALRPNPPPPRTLLSHLSVLRI